MSEGGQHKTAIIVAAITAVGTVGAALVSNPFNWGKGATEAAQVEAGSGQAATSPPPQSDTAHAVGPAPLTEGAPEKLSQTFQVATHISRVKLVPVKASSGRTWSELHVDLEVKNQSDAPFSVLSYGYSRRTGFLFDSGARMDGLGRGNYCKRSSPESCRKHNSGGYRVVEPGQTETLTYLFESYIDDVLLSDIDGMSSGKFDGVVLINKGGVNDEIYNLRHDNVVVDTKLLK